MSTDYRDRRSRIATRAEKAPNEAIISSSEYSRAPRLYYPHYATMFEHEGMDPQKARHETIRRIYLWDTPADKRASRPRDDPVKIHNFESKYRSVIKDRKDHEWSRKYYYPSDDYKTRKDGENDFLLESSPRRSSNGDSSTETYHSSSSTSSSSKYESDYSTHRLSTRDSSPRRDREGSSTREAPRDSNRESANKGSDRTLTSASSSRRLEKYLTSTSSKEPSRRSTRERRERESSPVECQSSRRIVREPSQDSIRDDKDNQEENQEEDPPKHFYVPEESESDEIDLVEEIVEALEGIQVRDDDKQPNGHEEELLEEQQEETAEAIEEIGIKGDDDQRSEHQEEGLPDKQEEIQEEIRGVVQVVQEEVEQEVTQDQQ